MTEREYGYLVINVGVFLLFSRGILLLIFLIKQPSIYLRNSNYKPLFWYALIAFSIAFLENIIIYLANQRTEFILLVLEKLEISNTFFTSPFFYINELIFISVYFSKILKINKIFFFGVFLACIELLNTFFFEGYKDAQTYGSLIVSFWNIFLSGLYFSKESKEVFKRNIFKSPVFYFSSGLFISNSLSIFIYFITKALFKDNTILFYKISIFRMIIEALCFLAMGYGIGLIKKEKVYCKQIK
ncbi:hypothetical protein VB796_03765 [Arcicella sp. LKC2W]|uniref:hypothetical protein n=1 Tax=Arcicella sp. LKC2W TaxID=2984198 RepID=UPI002B2047F4|nr:hypothetical protein [Arcicella sp. LKC2W]MEA5458135.1 hypothetical protein [Arcicella sp. LKC2W]